MIDFTAILTLLILCQHLLSEKDIRELSKFWAYSRDEDAFADRIRSACGHVLQLRLLLPVTTTLSAIGAGMERREEITLLPGDDYVQKTFERLTEHYLSTGDNKQ
ncbi:hypothetical protein GH771_23275 (plasmid) [Enterobacter cancerogenus]|nr:hypothetical protein GH771_23275 [Enterobacter cancerogenus]